MCLLLNHREIFRVTETFFFPSNGWSHQCDLRFFFSRTIEKLGRTCDQIGRTLEPCTIYLSIYLPISPYLLNSKKFLSPPHQGSHQRGLEYQTLISSLCIRRQKKILQWWKAQEQIYWLYRPLTFWINVVLPVNSGDFPFPLNMKEEFFSVILN